MLEREEEKPGGPASLRCPKCRGRSFNLYERLEVADCFPVRDGIAQPKCADESMPKQIGFTATCLCGHGWTPRYASAMAVIDAENEEAADG